MTRRHRKQHKKFLARSFGQKRDSVASPSRESAAGSVLELIKKKAEERRPITFRPGDYTPVQEQPAPPPLHLFRPPTGDSWMARGRCVTEGHNLREFFEDVWPEDDDGGVIGFDLMALAKARSVCDRCPVRRKCYVEACDEEGNAKADLRYGVRAGTTPAQRWSARHRQAIRCPVCSAALDPNSVRAGEITCVNECAIDRTMPPIPEEGDQWTRRHTTLARKIVKWLIESVEVGESIPRPTVLATHWSERKTDTCRVYEALVADGTLEFDGKEYRRHTRLAASHASYLPGHLVLLTTPVPSAA